MPQTNKAKENTNGKGKKGKGELAVRRFGNGRTRRGAQPTGYLPPGPRAAGAGGEEKGVARVLINADIALLLEYWSTGESNVFCRGAESCEFLHFGQR